MSDLKVANGEERAHFTVEDIWHEKPLGYHVREGGKNLPEVVWKSRDQRKEIFRYCPEVVMVMDMKLERERCEGDKGDGTIDVKQEDGKVQDEKRQGG